MAEFLTTYGTSSRIEEIMIYAKREIYLVSPFLQLSRTFHERLKDASENKVKISIVFGKDELNPKERNSLAKVQNLDLFYCENLHAKCYFNESKMVITSMNMYEFSEKNNREMGVFIDSQNDTELFESSKREAFSIIKSAEPINLNKSDRLTPKEQEYKKYLAEPINDYNQRDRGYCIRCNKWIPLDPTRPYCIDCFSIWAQWENLDFQENNCHVCGEHGHMTMAKPLCNKCYNNY